jgi:hypothetical protein
MTKKTRKILFLVFFFLFLLIAPTAIFYSQGYRLDFENKKFSQTGGLFLKILPKQVEVYLDGKLREKTDFFFGSILIENLLPKKYKIEIKKEGYYPWEKTLEVKEKEVTEAKNVILFPENLNLTILFKEVENFWFSPDQRKIILKEGSEKSWALKLYELDKDVKSHLIAERDIWPVEADLLDLKFSEDSKEISLEIGAAEQIKYFTLALNKTPPTLVESEPPLPPLENVVSYQEVNNDIYYLDNFGHLFKNEGRLTENPFSVRPETEYELKIFQDYLFLREAETLYQFNHSSKSFENFFEGIQDLKISPDAKKLVYFSDYEIWILFLKDESPQKKTGNKIFLMRLSEKIRDCLWLNSHYLVFNVGDTIKISEIDERDKINVINIGELKNPRIFWNKVEKRLYLLSEGNLFRSRILLP